MFAAAKADLEMERPFITEKVGGGDLPFFRDREGREQGIDQLLLTGAELVARLAAVEAVERGGVAGFMRSHGRALSGAGLWGQAGWFAGLAGPAFLHGSLDPFGLSLSKPLPF